MKILWRELEKIIWREMERYGGAKDMAGNEKIRREERYRKYGGSLDFGCSIHRPPGRRLDHHKTLKSKSFSDFSNSPDVLNIANLNQPSRLVQQLHLHPPGGAPASTSMVHGHGHLAVVW